MGLGHAAVEVVLCSTPAFARMAVDFPMCPFTSCEDCHVFHSWHIIDVLRVVSCASKGLWNRCTYRCPLTKLKILRSIYIRGPLDMIT